MRKFRKMIVKLLKSIGITPYVYYAYKWNDPFIIKNKLFGNNEELIIFDIGAYDGRSADLYKDKFPKSTIYSFEPTPKMFTFLEKKYAGRSDIKIFNYAMTSFVGEASFKLNKSLLTNSLLQSSKNDYVKIQSAYETDNEIVVETETIDSIIERLNISKINILKIDVQGADLSVLKGAKKTLKNNKIDLIYIEVEFLELYDKQPLYHDISSYMKNMGYDLFSLYNLSISKKGQMVYGDAIFIHASIKL